MKRAVCIVFGYGVYRVCKAAFSKVVFYKDEKVIRKIGRTDDEIRDRVTKQLIKTLPIILISTYNRHIKFKDRAGIWGSLSV